MYNRNEYDKQYRKNNKEKLSKGMKQWRKEHPEYYKEYHKQYYKNNIEKWKRINPEKHRQSQIKSRFGLSHEDWLKIWDSQSGRCVICGKRFIKPSNACVDHNHKTGKIRGLLCITCNSGLGFFKDDPKLTAKATEYLLR